MCDPPFMISSMHKLTELPETPECHLCFIPPPNRPQVLLVSARPWPRRIRGPPLPPSSQIRLQSLFEPSRSEVAGVETAGDGKEGDRG